MPCFLLAEYNGLGAQGSPKLHQLQRNNTSTEFKGMMSISFSLLMLQNTAWSVAHCPLSSHPSSITSWSTPLVQLYMEWMKSESVGGWMDHIVDFPSGDQGLRPICCHSCHSHCVSHFQTLKLLDQSVFPKTYPTRFLCGDVIKTNKGRLVS